MTWKRVALAGMLLLAACDEVLYDGLSQREANQLVTALRESGIDAVRTNGADGTFSVATARGDFAQAVRILEQKGLPREHFQSITDIFSAEGLLSSPLEERARLAHALSQELTKSLIAIDGIIDARVHLTLSRDQPLSEEDIPATASVLLIHAPDLDMEALVPDIKFLISKGVPDLDYREVSVISVPQGETAPAAGTPPPMTASVLGAAELPAVSGQTSALWLGLAGIAGAVAACGAGLAVLLMRRKRAEAA